MMLIRPDLDPDPDIQHRIFWIAFHVVPFSSDMMMRGKNMKDLGRRNMDIDVISVKVLK
jgi:hypothetical protein